MKPRMTWRLALIGSLSIGAFVALAVACTGDDTSGAGPTPGMADDSGTDSSTNPGSDTGANQPDTGAVLAPPGCFSGPPATSLEFQNACTGAAFEVFDNCARLGVCDGAALPPLVTPPADAGSDASGGGDGSGGDASDAALGDD
jgi:hypothetical protein